MFFLRLSFFLILFVFQCSFGQTTSYFTGTKLSITKPNNSYFDNIFPILTNEKGLFTITVNECNFNESTDKVESNEKMFQEFDSSTTSRKGVKVLEQLNFPVGKWKGMIIHAKLNSTINTLNLLFGDNTFFVIVSANYESNNISLSDTILDIYRTINYNQDLKINWNDFLPLFLSENSNFQLAEKQFSSSVLKLIPLNSNQDSCNILITKIPNKGRFYNLDEFIKFIILPQFESSFELKEILFEEKKKIGVNDVHFIKVECYDSEKKIKIIYFACWLNDKYGVALAGISSKSTQEFINTFYKNIQIKEL